MGTQANRCSPILQEETGTWKQERWWGPRESRDQPTTASRLVGGGAPSGSLGRAEGPAGLCHTSPGPGGRNFLKGFCREMGRRKEEKALGGPPDHGCVCAAHEYFSGHLFIPAPSSCWGHRPKVDKYSHGAINEASAPPQPHPLGPAFPQPAGWAPCPAQLVSGFH